MAEIRPYPYPERPNTDFYRMGEWLLFDACSSLPDDWYALYSVRWVLPGARRPQGEADFVFIGPTIGLIVVEVKGGGIEKTPRGEWYSVDRNSNKYLIKRPPAQQAEDNIFAIREYFKRQGLANIIAGMPQTHMVCFPQINKNNLPPQPDLWPDMIIDERDLPCLETVLQRWVQSFNSTFSKRLTENECKLLADALSPSFETPGRWTTRLWEQQNTIERLTDEQLLLLNVVQVQGNHSINLTGPAGSGKTIAALHCGKRFLNEGSPVLVITPCRALREYYARILESDRNTLAVVLLDETITDELSRPWGCIIVDESQDVSTDVLTRVLAYRQSGVFKLFLHDSNQRLERGAVDLSALCANACFKKVLRNTREIGDFSTTFYLNASVAPDVVGPKGRAVEELVVRSHDELPQTIAAYISKIVDEEGFRYRDVVVLFGTSGGEILRKGGQSYSGISFRNAADVWAEDCDDAKCVACSGILAFRGLESQVVILCEVDHLIENELIEACYVGTSRAQYVLAIAGSSGTLNRIRELDLAPIAEQRNLQLTHLQKKQSNAVALADRIAVGYTCIAKVVDVVENGVYCELTGRGKGRQGLLLRSTMTLNGCDLEDVFQEGQKVSIRVSKIDKLSGEIDLELLDDVVGVGFQ